MPRVVVLAGINGAGKTTASRGLLTDVLRIPTFVNADAIARGLNGMNPEGEAVRAGRIMLHRLRELAATGEDFAFETTLSARTYAGWLRDLRARGYKVLLYYYWLESAELAVTRVAERVRSGGHNVPAEDVRRRYARSVWNFFNLYRPIADEWEVYNNTRGDRRLIAIGDSGDEAIGDEIDWSHFLRSADDA